MDAVRTFERRDRLRRTALARRAALSKTEVSLWSEQIQSRALALDCYRSAAAIALYSPIQNEVDTGNLLDHALASGKRVFLPRWLEQGFGFCQITSRSELSAGRFGILEPAGAMGLADADRQSLLVFVPGVVFDTRGNRLGRGGGSYDRLIAQFTARARIVGLAYELQIVDAVPAQSWDCGMHFIITEERTINCMSNLRFASLESTGN